MNTSVIFKGAAAAAELTIASKHTAASTATNARAILWDFIGRTVWFPLGQAGSPV